MKLSAILLSTGLLAGAWARGVVTLVADGQPHAAIVVGEKPTPTETMAAEELQGHVRRMSGALREAKAWKPFRVGLCPSLAGLQIQRGGGWCSLELDPAGDAPLVFRTHPLRR